MLWVYIHRCGYGKICGYGENILGMGRYVGYGVYGIWAGVGMWSSILGNMWHISNSCECLVGLCMSCATGWPGGYYVQ